MSTPRRFDHDAARRRYAQGETMAALALEYAVTKGAIWNVVSGYVPPKQNQRRDFCVDCDQPCANPTKKAEPRCRRCAAIVAATSAREGELLCFGCREWKPDEAFAHNRTEKYGRRERHTLCRVCLTVSRREYRDSRKVTCEGGCGKLVEGKGRANSRTGRNGARIPLDPNRPYLCHPCALRRVHGRQEAA